MRKETPIPFSADLIPGILSRVKTVTRRQIAQPRLDPKTGDYLHISPVDKMEEVIPLEEWISWNLTSKYGKVGDLLWVKEDHYMYGEWYEIEGEYTVFGRRKKMFIPSSDTIYYLDNPPPDIKEGRDAGQGWYKRIGRFMPKSAARIWLQITDLKIERLQDISEVDALAEGISLLYKENHFTGQYIHPEFGTDQTPIKCFEHLWKKINGPESWDRNDLVLAVYFEMVSNCGKTLLNTLVNGSSVV